MFRQRGFLLIPHRLGFDEGARYCDKISGRLASFVTKTQFEEIVYHLSLEENMNAEPCTKAGAEEGTKRIEVYVGGTDEDREGTWTTLYSREEIQVLRLRVEGRGFISCPAPPMGRQQTLQRR